MLEAVWSLILFMAVESGEVAGTGAGVMSKDMRSEEACCMAGVNLMHRPDAKLGIKWACISDLGDISDCSMVSE